MHKPNKCVHCGKPKADHKAVTLNCPFGRKERIVGYTQFHKVWTYTQKKEEGKKDLRDEANAERYCAWLASQNGNRQSCNESLAKANALDEQAASLEEYNGDKNVR